MDSVEIKLSIITPCFNAKQFISNCIENVIQQNCPNIEHLILDGGSTDGTIELIESYTRHYSHIRFLSEQDKGQSDAMNKGIQLAKGTYIGFLNADDGYMPFTLNRVVELIKRQQQPVVLVGNCKLVTTDFQVRYINRPQRLQAYHLYSGLEPYPINPCAYFYAKTIHTHSGVGLYDIENHFNMDYDFFLKVCLHFPLIYHNEDWGYMLDHAEAKTAKDQLSSKLEERKKFLLQERLIRAPKIIKLQSYLYKLKKYVLG